MTTLFLIVYVIHQNCHLELLRVPRFIFELSLVFCCTHPHFYFLQKCHHFINLGRHQIRERHCIKAGLPTERTESCSSLQHRNHHTHTHTHASRKGPLCSKLSLRTVLSVWKCRTFLKFLMSLSEGKKKQKKHVLVPKVFTECDNEIWWKPFPFGPNSAQPQTPSSRKSVRSSAHVENTRVKTFYW